jgi:hypothetical protein
MQIWNNKFEIINLKIIMKSALNYFLFDNILRYYYYVK